MTVRLRTFLLAAALGASPAVLANAPVPAPAQGEEARAAAAAAHPVIAAQRDRASDTQGIRNAEQHMLMPGAPDVAVPRLDLQSIAGQSGIRGDTPEKARRRQQAKLEKQAKK